MLTVAKLSHIWRAVAVLALLLCAPAAKAVDFGPMVAELAPSGPGAEATFRLTNDLNIPMAVEANMTVRGMSRSGENIDVVNADDFIIIPPQFVVPAGQSQIIRVRWIGDPNLSEETAFRLTVSQVPVRMAQVDGASALVAFAFAANVYVQPTGGNAASNLEVKSATRVDSDEGPKLRVTLNNTGTKRAVLNMVDMAVADSAGTVWPYSGEATQSAGEKDAFASVTVLPGHERDVDLPWPDALAPGAVRIERFNVRYLVE